MPTHQQTNSGRHTEDEARKKSQTDKPKAGNSLTGMDVGTLQRVKLNPEQLPAAQMVQLQRVVGNRAVSRLLAEARSLPHLAAAVQREVLPPEDELPVQDNSADLTLDHRPRITDLQMKPLPAQKPEEVMTEGEADGLESSAAPSMAAIIQRRIGHGGEKGDEVRDKGREGLRFVIENVKKKGLAMPKFGRNYSGGVTMPVESYLVADMQDDEHTEKVGPEDDGWELLKRERRLAAAQDKKEEAEEKWQEDADEERGLLATSFASKKDRLLELKTKIEAVSKDLDPIITRLTGKKGEASTLETLVNYALTAADKISTYVPGAQVALPYIKAIKTIKTLVTTIRLLVNKIAMLTNPAQEPLLDAAVHVDQLSESMEEVAEIIGEFEGSDQKLAGLWLDFSGKALQAIRVALALEASARTALGGSNEEKEKG